LLTDRLELMITFSAGVGIASAVVGYYAAMQFDVSISGMMAVVAGMMFATAALFSPSHGLLARTLRRRSLRERFAVELLTLHLHHHEAGTESFADLAEELNWERAWLDHVVGRGIALGWLRT